MVSAPKAGTMAALPAKALILDVRHLRVGADQRTGSARAVGLAEGVPAGNQRDRLFVVHRHAIEGLANVLGRRPIGSGFAARAFRIDVDEAHLHGCPAALPAGARRC